MRTETSKALRRKGMMIKRVSPASHVTHLQYLTALCTGTEMEKV